MGCFNPVSATSTDTITITAMDSCGSHSWGSWHTVTYIDRCPFCGGSLRLNPKGTYEHELTCSRCSADFCGYCGHEKSGHSNIYLTVYTPPNKFSIADSILNHNLQLI